MLPNGIQDQKGTGKILGYNSGYRDRMGTIKEDIGVSWQIDHVGKNLATIFAGSLGIMLLLAVVDLLID